MSARTIDFCLPVLFDEWLEIAVEVGADVAEGTVVARGAGAGLREVGIREVLGLKEEEDVMPYMKKEIGDAVKKGDVVAQKGKFIGKKVLYAKEDGILDSLVDGVLFIKNENDERIEVLAPISGTVSAVEPGKVELSLKAEAVSGVYGWGDLSWGDLLYLEPNEGQVRLELVDGRVSGKVVLIEEELNQAMWFKLAALGARGVICAGVPSTFETWAGRQALLPGLVVLGQDPKEIDAKMLAWLKKKIGSHAFLLPLSGEIVIVK